MNLVLERVNPNSVLAETTCEDLFDSTGTLLLKKGLQINENIRERFLKHEIYVLQFRKDLTTQCVKEFRKDVYVNIVGSLWSIYHDAKLIEAEKFEKTVGLVSDLLEEILTQNTFPDLKARGLDFMALKQDNYWTFVHVINVAVLSSIMGMHMGYREKRLKNLTLGALLHDLGKSRIPKEILNKPGSLLGEESNLIKQHPLMGSDLIKESQVPSSVLAAIKEHHERWNGQGYPYGISGNDIHRDAQIIAVADVYDALTADRPYRKGYPPYHALEMVITWSGKDFNPKVVQAFRESLILYPEKSMVTLNTGERGVVLAVPTQRITRPLIRLLFDQEGRSINKEIYVDLMTDLNPFIERVEFNK